MIYKIYTTFKIKIIVKILNLFIILSCTHLYQFFPVSIHLCGEIAQRESGRFLISFWIPLPGPANRQRHASPIDNTEQNQSKPHHGTSRPHHLHHNPTPRKYLKGKFFSAQPDIVIKSTNQPNSQSVPKNCQNF